ncbi:MAG: STAS domain-containing protein [Proteobacteria bacterium]|nr:STAS domain-containing protein [Pseudomonadota bacterium]
MEIADHKIDDYVVLGIDGNLVFQDIERLQEVLDRYVDDSTLAGIIINCERVKYIDSFGLGMIVTTYKDMKKRDKKLALTALNKKTMEIFNLTKLDKVLTIANSDKAALKTLNKRVPQPTKSKVEVYN